METSHRFTRKEDADAGHGSAGFSGPCRLASLLLRHGGGPGGLGLTIGGSRPRLFFGRGMSPRPATKGAYPIGFPDERLPSKPRGISAFVMH